MNDEIETAIRRAINRSFVGQASLLVLGFAFVALAAVIWRLLTVQ